MDIEIAPLQSGVRACCPRKWGETRRQRGSGIPQAESEAARGWATESVAQPKASAGNRRRKTAAAKSGANTRTRYQGNFLITEKQNANGDGWISSRWRPVLAATTRWLRTRAVVPRAVVVVSPRPALRRPRRRALLRRRRCSPISTRVALTATSPHSRRLRRVGSTAGAPSRGCRSATNWAAVVPRRPVGS